MNQYFNFQTEADIKAFDFDAYLTKIIDFVDEIKWDEITVLTGSNSSGKSLIRKLTSFEDCKTISASMERRTVANHNFGALSGLAMDDPEKATSMNTYHLFYQLFNSQFRDQGDQYIILDEIEIGMGKEVLLGFLEKIKSWIDKNKEASKFHGALFITHNEMVVDYLCNHLHAKFLNMEGLTMNAWFNRRIVAADPELVENAGYELWRAVEARKNKNSKSQCQHECI